MKMDSKHSFFFQPKDIPFDSQNCLINLSEWDKYKLLYLRMSPLFFVYVEQHSAKFWVNNNKKTPKVTHTKLLPQWTFQSEFKK